MHNKRRQFIMTSILEMATILVVVGITAGFCVVVM